MNPASSPSADSIAAALDPSTDLNFALPNPEDENLSEFEFQRQIELAWQVCDRFANGYLAGADYAYGARSRKARR